MLVAVSELLATVHIFYVLKSRESIAIKCVLSVVAVIPVIGLFFSYWIFNLPDKQPLHLQNNGPRGEYADRMWDKIWPHRKRQK